MIYLTTKYIIQEKMRNKILFSIIVPTYNSVRYIEELLINFVKIKKDNTELIIVDDGSTDNTKDICLKYLSENIKYYYKNNGGPSSARNYGTEKSNGIYLAFLDSDDRVEFNNLYNNFEYAENRNLDLLIIPFFESKYQIYTEVLVNKNYELSKLIISEEINSPCNKIYKKEIIKNNNIKFDDKYDLGEDLLFNIDYYKVCKNIEFSNTRYYYYIKRENSLTKKYRKNKICSLIDVNNKLYNKCKEFDENVIDSINCIRIKNFYSCLLDICNCDKSYKEKKHFVKNLKKIFDCKKVKNFKYEMLRKIFIFLPESLLTILIILKNNI